MKVFFFVLLTQVLLTLGFYQEVSDIQELTESTFAKTVLSADKVWIIEFYAPWCGHCKNLVPVYKTVAAALKNTGVHVGAVDATINQQLAAQYGVQGYPTIKIFSNGKAVDYTGDRSAKSIAEAGFSALRKIVLQKIDPKPSSQSSSKESEKKSRDEKTDVVQIGDEDEFDELVLNSTDMWLVEFYAPWCGHCKALAPEWEQAATNLAGTGIKLAAVDATQNEALSSRFKISGFPTIKVFPPRSTKDSHASDYQGERVANKIVEFAESAYTQQYGGSISVSIQEVNSQKELEETCFNSNGGKCVIFVLPDIYDSKKEGRNRYLQQIGDVQRQVRHIPFVWIAAGSQSNFENHFGLGFGFPAIVYLRRQEKNQKPLGFVFRGKFEPSAINAFVSSGKKLSEAIEGCPPFIDSLKWNGEDAISIDDQDDDFDLESFLKEN